MSKVSAVRAGCLALALASAARPAVADPEWNTGVIVGVAGTGTHGFWSHTSFEGALRADVLFGRSHASDLGVGPAVEVGTVGFSDLRTGGGATALVPFGDLIALGLTPGGYVRLSDGGAVGGVSGRVFLGARALNLTGSYALANGIQLGFDQDLGATRQHAVTVAAQIDAALLALPFVFLVEWVRGPRAPDAS